MVFKALVFLLLLATTAAAQNAPIAKTDTNSEARAPHQFTSADTLQALQQLFKNRRTRGAFLLGGTGAVVVASNIVLNNESGIPSSDASSNVIVASGIALLYSAPLWVIGTSQLVRFSKKREQTVIEAFVTKYTLPSKIQRRLTPGLLTSH